MIKCWFLKWRVIHQSDCTTKPTPALQAHLEGCANCRAWFERQQKIDRVLVEAQDDDTPVQSQLHAGIMAAVRTVSSDGGVRPIQGFPPAAYALAGALVVAVVAGLVWLQQPGESQLAPTIPAVAEHAEPGPVPPGPSEDYRVRADQLLTTAYRQELDNIAADLQSTSEFLASCFGESVAIVE